MDAVGSAGDVDGFREEVGGRSCEAGRLARGDARDEVRHDSGDVVPRTRLEGQRDKRLRRRVGIRRARRDLGDRVVREVVADPVAADDPPIALQGVRSATCTTSAGPPRSEMR